MVETDAAEPGPAEQGGEVRGECGSLDRGSVGANEGVAAVLPVFARRLTFLALLVMAVRE
ncbi:hypothetical protein GCM10010430_17740 [Kitasatospora cystarginea]|uniref:Uncharacterized protein n=1 Tax=Kitasatospora cystarginea TaxID=58350 RepID=A0ABN3DNB4_9ACTN